MGNTEDREPLPQEDDDAIQQYADALDETTKHAVLSVVQKMVEDAVRIMGETVEKRFQTIEARLETLEQRHRIPSNNERESGGISQEVYMDLEEFMEALEKGDSRTRVNSNAQEVQQASNDVCPVSSAASAASSSTPRISFSVPTPTSSVSSTSALISPGASSTTSFADAIGCISPTTPPYFPPGLRDDLEVALLEAAQEERMEDLQALLDSGADVNVCDDNGWSALIWSCCKSHADAVALLLEKGADVNAKNSVGWTALHFASVKDASGCCVALLVEAGANVNSKNNGGSTPLHEAAGRGNAEAVRVLMAAGADKRMENSEGQTPVHMAHGDLVKWILRR